MIISIVTGKKACKYQTSIHDEENSQNTRNREELFNLIMCLQNLQLTYSLIVKD